MYLAMDVLAVLPTLAGGCHWPRTSKQSSCSASTPRLCRACTEAEQPASSWRVAVVHIPKTGGMSIGKALAKAAETKRRAACNVQTAGIPLCPCLCDSCFSRSVALIAECSSSTIALHIQKSVTASAIASTRWLYVATIREPRAWFLSAVSQWCRSTGEGRSSPRCRTNTTADDLVRAGWWSNPFNRLMRMDSAERREALASKALDLSTRYFEGTNEQSAYLGGHFFKQEHYLVCALERIQSVSGAIGSLLFNSSGSLPALSSHRARKRDREHIQRWQETVRWHTIGSRFYAEDEKLYKEVSAAGCIARSTSSWLRGVINDAAGGQPVLWRRHREKSSRASTVGG